jgi:hypothetical protein
MECIDGVEIPTPLIEPCRGDYISTDCIASPSANVTLDLPIGANQTQTNTAITSALVYKEQQITNLQAQLDLKLW